MFRTCPSLITKGRLHLGRCSLSKIASTLKSDEVEEVPANRQKVVLPKIEGKPSQRYLEFRERLRSEAPLDPLLPESAPHPAHEKEPLEPWPNNTNPHTGEIGGQAGPEPTRYGDWERKGRVTDF
ncbi:succinate dehydrogenase assembly factor 4, mitochondrial [Drosophila takahashii]|uniref:succinate dehydrogenase assembly factor 4, mitochondrial n=1 Tax=Drosophila takahashii TaxID=29030 RepID=UPI001CF83266|nr:succinate dehydrogenase assembly factor 4, mitochondrial [Drosophila takahashii]